MRGWNAAVTAYAAELRGEGLVLDVRGSAAEGFRVSLKRAARGRKPGQVLGSRRVDTHALSTVKRAVADILSAQCQE